jgi:hypothetical protein
VALGDCSHESAKWILDIDFGIVSSIYLTPVNSSSIESQNDTATPTDYDATSNNFEPDMEKYKVCMTTGWPFLQMGAFKKTSKISENHSDDDIDKTVVVMNEARESANYVLFDENTDSILLSGSIPPRSIQTILL